MAVNSHKFDRRFWKVLAITFIQITLLLALVLTFAHLIFGHSPASRFLFEAAPPIFTGLGIKLAMTKLRKSESL